MTLENYIERYHPLSLIKILKKVLIPVFDEKQGDKLRKFTGRYTVEIQQQILEDMGEGTIFDNI